MSNLALIKKDTVDIVAERIRAFQNKGEIHFPINYSPENALKSAWLILQSTTDKNGKPALEVCTKDSIANALLDMVIQGLNPSKKQCYFVVYGNKLICQRSYFGSMYLAKEMAGAKNIYAQVVYKGDEFEYEIVKGRKKVIKHIQKIENISNNNIIAAYCVIEFDDGRSDYTEIMTIEQIKQAWKQSVLHPVDEKGNIKTGTTHEKFTEEMAKKTVINRACKALINSSNDSNLFLRAFNRSDEEIAEHELEEEIKENANKELIDVEYDVDYSEEEQEKETQQEEDEQQQKKQNKEPQQQSIISEGPDF
jgi:recombination protein RecT